MMPEKENVLIRDPNELRPDTLWTETRWAHTSVESLADHTTRARLCIATLLPFKNGKPDWQGFENSVRWMQACADHYETDVAYVLNADTGYIFQLDEEMYREVIEQFRNILPDARILCGTTALNTDPDPNNFSATDYRPQIEIAQSFDNVEIMIMTSRPLNGLDPERRRDVYFEIVDLIRQDVPAIVHALGPSFISWATPFEPWLLYQFAQHPRIVGGKISTLNEPHFLYWAAMCRDLGLDFLPHSGDDYDIATAIRIGQPLLIGAGVSACPLICAARDMWLADRVAGKAFPTGIGGDHFDTRVYKLFEAFQSLEDDVFRLNEKGSAAAYKHSTAACLQLLGLIASEEIHPDCPDHRGSHELDRMREALRRPLQAAQRLGIPHYRINIASP